MDNIELAWAAGFYDGEGCTSVSTRKKNGLKQLFLVVTQCGDYAPELLTRFQQAVEAGSVSRVRAKKLKESYLDQYRWQCGAYEVCQHVMTQLWPYLGTSKKQQYERCLTVMQAYKKTKGH